MKVKLKKRHKAWELYPELYVGAILELKDDVLISNTGTYDPKELCKCFSNHCSYSDLFEKV